MEKIIYGANMAHIYKGKLEEQVPAAPKKAALRELPAELVSEATEAPVANETPQKASPIQAEQKKAPEAPETEAK